MSYVREQYRKSSAAGFDGFLDEIKIRAVDGQPELFVRGWGRISGSPMVEVECFDVRQDALAGRVAEFFERSDLPDGARAFEAHIPLSGSNSVNHYDYGLLVRASDGRLFPIYHHSPENIQIELEGRCNLACVMCPQAFGVHSGPMSIDDLEMLRPVIERSECIEINHQGEALTSPILLQLLQMVPPHKHIAFNNNGTALKAKVARQLLEYAPPVRTISISIDAGTEDSFFKIRGTSLAKIMENARAFKKARDDAGLEFPRIMVTCTVIKDFMEFVPAIVELASQLDGYFRYWPLTGSGLHGGESWVTPFKGSEEMFVYDEQIPRDGRTWGVMADRIQAEAERLGVNIVHPFRYSWKAEGDLVKPTNKGSVAECSEIFRKRFFNANGNAQLCCVQTEPMFNWREYGPENFDKHPSVIEARELAAQGIIPGPCSGASCSYVAGALSPTRNEKPLTYIERKFI